MDFSKIKAAMFDFDGTVTPKGEHQPRQVMADALVDLANVMPIAFCTGRQLESFVRRGLSVLLQEIEPNKRLDFMKNLHLMAENGSIGYDFNAEKEEFEEFYRAQWPEEFLSKEKFKNEIGELVAEWGEVYFERHRVIVVIRTHLDYMKDSVDDVYKHSDKIYEIICEYLSGIGADYKGFLHVGNSGIGVVVVPADGDKDAGIREFGKFLERKREMSFDENFEEIMVVGDRPQVGGNDYYFLNGRYGAPFTVGNLGDKAQKVLNDKGKRLLHDEGTLHLIGRILA